MQHLTFNTIAILIAMLTLGSAILALVAFPMAGRKEASWNCLFYGAIVMSILSMSALSAVLSYNFLPYALF